MRIISALFGGHAGLDHPYEIIGSPEELIELHKEKDDRPLCVVLHGGVDLHWSWTRETSHPLNQQSSSPRPSLRDFAEINIAKAAINLGIPVFGICRGAQLGCVVSGGSLFQHHEVKDKTDHNGEVYQSIEGPIRGNSYHHQLMDLQNLREGEDYELLAWTEYRKVNLDPKLPEGKTLEKQPEIVWFPKTKIFAVQGHPEWAVGTPFQKFCIEQFKKRAFKNV